MPRQTLIWEIPPKELAVLEIMGSKSMAAIARFVALHPESTTATIASAVGLRKPSTLRLLATLENAGIVSGTPGPDDRASRTVTWAILPAGVATIASRWQNYLTGGPVEPAEDATRTSPSQQPRSH